MFKLDHFGVILFVSFSYKKLLQCSFYENLKNRLKIQKFFVYYNEELETNSNFKRNYLENYNDSEHVVKTKMLHFYDFSESQLHRPRSKIFVKNRKIS